MKNYLYIFLIIIFISCNSKNQKKTNTDSQLVEDPYLFQKRPSLVAEPFKPGVLTSKGWELPTKFTPGLSEFYMTNSNQSPFDPAVIVFRKENNDWKRHDFYATLSNSDSILYSKTNYIERTDAGWSEMKSLGPMFDREDWGIMRLSASADGTFVLDDWKNNDVIRISRIKNGKREEPKLLSKEINTGKWTAHPYISADGSYIIWDSEREGGYGDSDIYISFRQEDESWGLAINMGPEINTSGQENAAMLTRDGKYLFFGRAKQFFREDGSSYWEGGKYWIDSKIIENLRSTH